MKKVNKRSTHYKYNAICIKSSFIYQWKKFRIYQCLTHSLHTKQIGISLNNDTFNHWVYPETFNEYFIKLVK